MSSPRQAEKAAAIDALLIDLKHGSRAPEANEDTGKLEYRTAAMVNMKRRTTACPRGGSS